MEAQVKLTSLWRSVFMKYIDEKHMREVDTLAEADGVWFVCPKCAAAQIAKGNSKGEGAHGVLCWFKGKVPDSASPGPGRWVASGTNMEDLTLSPSVFLNGQESCGWHGFVRNGDAA